MESEEETLYPYSPRSRIPTPLLMHIRAEMTSTTSHSPSTDTNYKSKKSNLLTRSTPASQRAPRVSNANISTPILVDLREKEWGNPVKPSTLLFSVPEPQRRTCLSLVRGTGLPTKVVPPVGRTRKKVWILSPVVAHVSVTRLRPQVACDS